jgi:molecular chaperone GrpE (heat shock protein)
VTDHALLAWLGPAATDLTAEQIERVAAESREIDARYPQDQQHERDAALSAVVQHLLGETTAEDADRALIAARRAEREAYAAALQVAVMLVRDGERKATAARRAGVDRMSLLKALGER